MTCPECYSENIYRFGLGAACQCQDCQHRYFDSDLYQTVQPAVKRFEKSQDWQHECKECGKVFSAARSRGVRFCSPECRAKAWRKEQLKPHKLLKNDPYQLERYPMLVEISPSSADIVAKVLARSIPDGLEVMQACLSMPHPYKADVAEIAEKHGMDIHSLIEKRFAAV